MQLHEAGVGPEEPRGASGPSPPVLPAQVMVPPTLALGAGFQANVTSAAQSPSVGWW